MNIFDDSNSDRAVVHGASNQIADIVCFVVERVTLFGWNDYFPTGPSFCFGDGVDIRKLEHNAALVFSGRKPVGDYLRLVGLSWCAIEIGLGEVDTGVIVEAVGKIGEEVGKNLPFSALGTEQMGENNPDWRGFHVDRDTIPRER